MLTSLGRVQVPGNRGWVVAYSGGADSLALLAALALLPAPQRPAFEAVHVDHGLRADSERDAEAALALARSLGARARSVRVTVEGRGGVEAAARVARYRALAREASGRPILTAHTVDDQAETLLLRLSRGAGLRGAGGIRFEALVEGARLVRPLLRIRRHEILAAIETLGLTPIEDPTNATDEFSRNRIRHGVLPILEEIAPGAAEALARFASIAEEDEDHLSVEAAKIRAGRTSIGREELLSLAPAIGKRVVRDLIEGCGGQTPSHRRIMEIYGLAAGRGGELHLPRGIVVRAQGRSLEVGTGPTGARARRRRAEGTTIEAWIAPGESRTYAGLAFHLEAVMPPHVGEGVWIPPSYPPPYRLRRVRRGERLEVPGVGRKKVSDLLGEHRIPFDRRWDTVLVETGDGRPIWLVGVRPLCPRPDPGETAFHLRTSEGKEA